MIDAELGIYQPDVVNMLQHYGLGDLSLLKRIYITHADADHCGAAGFFSAPSYLELETLKLHRKPAGLMGPATRMYPGRSLYEND